VIELLTFVQENECKQLAIDLEKQKALQLEVEAETQKSKQELRVFFERQLSDLRNSTNKEIGFRDTKLISLQEELDSKNREFTIWKERVRREIEIELIAKYEEQKKEFERRIQEETVYTLQKQEELLAEKKENLAKLEKDLMDKVLKQRSQYLAALPVANWINFDGMSDNL
jgi:hypothetical protein